MDTESEVKDWPRKTTVIIADRFEEGYGKSGGQTEMMFILVTKRPGHKQNCVYSWIRGKKNPNPKYIKLKYHLSSNRTNPKLHISLYKKQN